jgi:hypothetical protein
MNIRLTISILFIALSLVITGCASTIDVNVNSIIDTQMAAKGNRYILTSGAKEKSEADLYFREFSRYFDVVLKDAGFVKVANRDDADIEILFKYGISDGRTGVYSYSTPIYDFVGGETVTITEKDTGATGQKVTTIHIPARLERIGSSIETRSYTTYNRTASLEAMPVGKDSEKQKRPLLWQVYVYSVGDSNDLRFVMPYLAAAAGPYIGKNSGQQITTNLKHDDPAVMRIKNLALQPQP